MPRDGSAVWGLLLTVALGVAGAGACVTGPLPEDIATRRPPFQMEGAPGCDSVGPVAITPVNLGTAISRNLEAGGRRIQQQLVDYLVSKGCAAELLSEIQLERSWPPHVALSPGGFQRDSAAPAEIKPEAIAWLVRQLDRQRDKRLGAVVVPSMIASEVELSQAGARWDGVYRNILVSRKPRGYAIEQISGKATVLSLEVQVFDPTGQRWFQGVGGLVIPFRIRYEEGQGVMTMRRDPLRNPAQIRQAIEIALDPWVPR
ncbi:hypothetical protein MK489_12940 [Myxococcota bacterium]|nr:hypothetical protein [Myxococcota bacterium]